MQESEDSFAAAVAETGPIISGPVVSSSAFKDTLKSINRKIMAVETESSGVFRASTASNVPCLTIRGISDLADINKNALERTTKNAARVLAADNAISYFKILLRNPSFMRIAKSHQEELSQPQLFQIANSEPDLLIAKIAADLDAYLERMSPEYKHRPNNANLPLPRIMREFSEEEYDHVTPNTPKPIVEALSGSRGIYLRIPRSYPNQTLAWSIGQYLLRAEIDGKQILPLVVSGEEIIPPSKGIQHATGVDPSHDAVVEHFTPVIIISEPQFQSEPKIGYLVKEVARFAFCPVIVVSRADGPTEQIDRLKTDLALVDHVTAPVPFDEIANYLEAAFEMRPDEADAVANRLDETFSKFRLHTHPAYFVGLQEATIEALIQANQRAELIQLAVDGLLSFVVVFDESDLKLNRTTREEFLSDLSFEIKVEKRTFSKDDLYKYVQDFADRKALDIQPELFLRGYFSVGLLHESGGVISFSVPYLESYLLSERLRADTQSAARYFDPNQEDFDQYTFDLYVEQGACLEVVSNICEHARRTLANCPNEENLFLTKAVKPKALSTSQMLVRLTEQLSQAVTRMAETPDSKTVRQEKQRLLDTREAVRGRVASKDPANRNHLPADTKAEFERLDNLSRASTLLATMVGSGAERLDGSVKIEVGNLALEVFERFLHFWTKNRMKIDFDELREELESDEFIQNIIDENGLYEESKVEIRNDLMLFLDDQELRHLSGPGSVLFNRLAQYAGVRSLRPIFSKLKPEGQIAKLFRDIWLMDVDPQDGKRILKTDLQGYRGSHLLRLVITNHLMNRIFWHHWQRDSKSQFLDVARYSLAPLGLKPADEHARKMLRGPKQGPR